MDNAHTHFPSFKMTSLPTVQSPSSSSSPCSLSSSSSGLVQLLTSTSLPSTSKCLPSATASPSSPQLPLIGSSDQQSVSTTTQYNFQSVQNVNPFSLSDIGILAPPKRQKLDKILAKTPEIAERREIIRQHHSQMLGELKDRFSEHLSEVFFLQSGCFNAMDYLGWKKRANPQLEHYLKINSIDSNDDEDDVERKAADTAATVKTTTLTTTSTALSTSTTTSAANVVYSEVKMPSSGGTPVALSTTLPPAVSQLSQQGLLAMLKPKGGRHGMIFGNHQPLFSSVSYSLPLVPGGTPLVPEVPSQSSVSRPSMPLTNLSSVVTTTASNELNATSTLTTTNVKSPVTTVVVTPTVTSAAAAKLSRSVTSPASIANPSTSVGVAGSPPLPTPATPARLQTRLHSISAAYDSTIGSQEEIAERAKQEAYVMQRISELRKEGVWSEKRLPKLQEPPRSKAHWDYLLEEMSWLATDFFQERKWKKAAAKKCARMCQKYHQENKLKEERAEKEAEMKVKRIASAIAKEVKQFWANVEKFVEYKQQSRLDMKRKKLCDLQLNFIVDQTEKYSSWVAEGMNKSINESTQNSLVSSEQISRSSTPSKLQSKTNSSDEEFEPSEDSTDDEETIEKEEQEDNQDDSDKKAELDLLEKESLVPIEELLQGLPQEYLNGEPEPAPVEKVVEVKEEAKMDSDFEVKSEDESSDDESTMEAEEAAEGEIDYMAELNQLKDEGDMSLEDLVEMYKGVYDNVDSDDSSSTSSDDNNEQLKKLSLPEEKSSDEESECMSDEDDSGLDLGLESLVEMGDSSGVAVSDGASSRKAPGIEITDIAAAAESFKPKGYTYSTAQVAAKVPHLLRHQLREYQHIGLDWLVTMYDRKLNGILADEMGLGKTIQTISLLAYLACENGNWGPHLIVVPTSVMLNWEMEFKKWCPGFKILTYYGNPKERKQKRQGWTKPNTFHVCITSYKLVIQDHQSFRRKKWKYFILDEAQNIKNFKSQRWQLLLNFKSHRRLLLTGTPLQNSLMELWSLMHFLMPNVFLSHQDFKEWFANPVSGMIEGSHEYNKELINRLHKVLRPFLLRRLKTEVEKQLPSKYEHVVMCRLSKRQRYLYEDFMGQAKTKETLATGNFMSVINVLMQLRKVCNHPNLFESRPIVSPFQMEPISYTTASLATTALDFDPFKHINLSTFNMCLVDLELSLTAFAAHRIKRFQTPRKLIEEIDDLPDPPPRCPAGKIKLHVRTTSSTGLTPPATPRLVVPSTPSSPMTSLARVLSSGSCITVGSGSPLSGPRLATPSTSSLSTSSSTVTSITTTPTATTTTANGQRPVSTSYTLQLVQPQQTTQGGTISSSSTPITVHIHQTQQGPRLSVPTGQLAQLPAGYAQLVQTPSGQHILLTSSAATSSSAAVLQANTTVQSAGFNQRMTTPGRVTVSLSGVSSAAAVAVGAVAKQGGVVNSILGASVSPDVKVSQTATKPILRMTPMKSTLTSTISATGVTATSSSSVSSPTHITILSSSSTPSSRLVQENTKPLTRQQTKLSDELKSKSSSSSSPYSSPFYMEDLAQKRKRHRRERLERLARLNTRRCDATPVYGSDLIEAVTVIDPCERLLSSWKESRTSLSASERRHVCHNRWDKVTVFGQLLTTPEGCLDNLRDVLTRFSFVVPPVMAQEISFSVAHPPPWRLHGDKLFQAKLRAELSPKATFLHPLVGAMSTQFPDARLIQYDCGKLQTLDKLLRRLKSETRRVLIFTQMTRMLDVLEQFLNYHGHIYLRLDGATKVDQRQALMERFNADRRIFCFILSTRSGGIGVNLTGADTVIFYDSDWNPTMDAQAQDRCHRIGQTRDVHIFRLISERTVEENILKKAKQKRLLGEVAIEGGNFTTAFFKKHTLQELFEMDYESAKGPEKVPKEDEKQEPTSATAVAAIPGDISNVQLEHALANAEEDLDIQAAKSAKKEADLELAEFDESISYDGEGSRDEDTCKLEEELGAMMAELTPIQRYAMNFLELHQEPFSLEQLKQAEEEIEAQKKDWELGRLQALREEEERRAELDDSDMLVTYSREETANQIFVSANTGELMPIWAPPTPPQDDSDVYIDYSTCFLYEPNVMTESQLPPIYVRKELKRTRVDNNGLPLAKKQKTKKDENCVNYPRSLFDRPSAAMLKMRKDAKMQKFRPNLGNSTAANAASAMTVYKNPQMAHKQVIEPQQDAPEWLIHEDWALLQAVQVLLELPLSLIIVSPGHTPNWDLVADVVNATSRAYRSPKQCRIRYEIVIVPREEGKILYDINPNKSKKSKGIYRLGSQTKNNRPMKTSQLFAQDNGALFTQLFHQRFDTIKSVANKRLPTLKQMVNVNSRNPKHTVIVAESGINYDQPTTPVQVATMRAERISREKLKMQIMAPEQQQIVVTQQQMQAAGAVAASAAVSGSQVAAVSGLQLAARQPLQPQQVNVQNQQQQQILNVNQQQQQQMASTTQTVIGQITAQQLQNVIGRIAVTTATGLTPATVTSTVRPQRASPASGVSQLRSVIPQQQTQQPAIVSVSNSTIQQVVVTSPAQRVTPTAVVTSINPGTLSVQSSGKSPTQLQLYTRSPTLYKQQRLQASQQHQITTISVQQQQQQGGQGPQKIPVSVTSLLSPNVATVQLTHSQKHQLRNQATRTMTEADVTQLIKRQQLQQQLQQQQQQQKAGTQVTQIHVPSTGVSGGLSGPQIQQQVLSAAQLQQLQQHQQQQQQQSVAAAIASGQPSYATLVKTVSTPAALGTAAGTAVSGGSASSTVTIPVNIVSHPQVKGTGVTANKNVIVTQQQQQVEHLRFQQQILQQKKLMQQQKLAQITQAKSAIGAVQLVPQSGGHKGVPTTVTVQQIQQVMKSQAQSAQVQAASAGGLTTTSTANLVAANQSLSHTYITKAGQSVTQPTSVTTALQARVVPLGQNVTAVVPPGLSQTGGTTRQTIQVVTASPHGQLRLPTTGGTVTSGSTFTIDGSRAGTAQTVNVVATTTGAGTSYTLSAPTLTVTLPNTTQQQQIKELQQNLDDSLH